MTNQVRLPRVALWREDPPLITTLFTCPYLQADVLAATVDIIPNFIEWFVEWHLQPATNFGGLRRRFRGLP